MSIINTSSTGSWPESTTTTYTPKTQSVTIDSTKYPLRYDHMFDWFSFDESLDIWDKVLREIMEKHTKKTKRIPDPIKKVIFNYPATIVFWKDGTKTIVKCQYGEVYDKEKGIALCFMKKFFENKGYFNDIFKKYIVEDE